MTTSIMFAFGGVLH